MIYLDKKRKKSKKKRKKVLTTKNIYAIIIAVSPKGQIWWDWRSGARNAFLGSV